MLGFEQQLYAEKVEISNSKSYATYITPLNKRTLKGHFVNTVIDVFNIVFLDIKI